MAITLANRLARRILLGALPEGHPVRSNEDDLVEMAKSRLQELMLCHPGRSSSATRAGVEARIRRLATERVMRSDEDDASRCAAAALVQAMDLSDLFPVLN